MRRLACLAILASTSVSAQVSNPGANAADIASLRATALAAQTAVANVQPCTTVPLADTFTGTLGTAANCMPRADATRPTQVQPARGILGSDGTATIAWPNTFSGVPTYAHAEVLGGAAPYQCDVVTVTATNINVKCYQLYATTLGTTLAAVVGVVVSPFQNAAAGLTVMVVGRL